MNTTDKLDECYKGYTAGLDAYCKYAWENLFVLVEEHDYELDIRLSETKKSTNLVGAVCYYKGNNRRDFLSNIARSLFKEDKVPKIPIQSPLNRDVGWLKLKATDLRVTSWKRVQTNAVVTRILIDCNKAAENGFYDTICIFGDETFEQREEVIDDLTKRGFKIETINTKTFHEKDFTGLVTHSFKISW